MNNVRLLVCLPSTNSFHQELIRYGQFNNSSQLEAFLVQDVAELNEKYNIMLETL